MDSDWPTVALGTLAANFDKRRVPLSAKQRAERPGSFPYHGATGVMDYVDDFLFEGLHLLVAEDGSVEDENGKPVLQLVDGKFWVNNHAHVLRAASSSETKYLYYALATIHIRPYMSGSVQAKLSQANMNRIPVPYPPRRDREGIVKILGALDDKIELNRLMSETLEEMARALFSSVLARHWDGHSAVALGDVLSVLETGRRPRGGVKGIESGVPSVGAESITRIGEFDFSKTKYIPVDYFETMKRGIVEDFDVLLYKDGGKPGVYEPHVSMFGLGFPFETFCINEHVYRLRVTEPLTQSVLYYWLTSDHALEEMRTKGSGVAVPGLNSSAVRSLAFPILSEEAIDEFSAVGEEINTRILIGSRESRLLGVLRDTLLPKLISGELRVPDAERLVSEVA